MFKPTYLRLLLLASVPLVGCDRNSPDASKPSFAFITNGPADFWEIGEAGAEAAAEELGVNVTVIMPNSVTDQTRKIEDLITRGVDGIAISPINPANQAEILDKAAAEAPLITHDSDAPESKRLVYVGLDNYKAGHLCGTKVREALPDGGQIMLLIGRIDQDNAQRRRQGCIDGIFGRSADPSRNDPNSGPLEGDDKKYVILGTLTDGYDHAKAKANAEDTLAKHPDVDMMVGLYEYNPPLILEALDRAGKLGQVKVMAFDENEGTLQGVKDGNVVATIVQSPYRYGYESVKLLAELHQGNKSVIPESKFVEIPAQVIDATNVDAFREELNKRLGKN
jgi:ribose transport system substrate-binding protein